MTALLLNDRSAQRARGVRSAFTLIELLLVMVIIAILAAIVVPKFTGQGDKARIHAAQQDISNIKTALGTFEVENGRFPTSEEGIAALVTNPGNLPNWSQGLEKVPQDPWGKPYVYHCPGANGGDYDLYSTGKSGQDGNADNIH
jgi:general secretion pathway protein G